ncbi:MAG: rhomboid family intramembrane serine protease [Methylococcaceae bacterium]|nr:rhomboid family intramembrane serine protease [Methylococcaceae bacterium]
MIPIRDNIHCRTTPYVSWAIMAICIGIFFLMKMMPDETVRQLTYLYGMVPIRYSNPEWATAFGLPPDYYLSFITSLFIHGGWIHIIINMWFIWIFSKNIEDSMGHGKFLIFYLICGLFATVVQWYFDPDLMIPVVGASGAIAGVLGAYFFIYPYAKVVIWFPLFLLPIFFELPAIAFLGFWVIIQIQKATTAMMFDSVTADVAWWAHLGGFIAGAMLHPLFISDKKQE